MVDEKKVGEEHEDSEEISLTEGRRRQFRGIVSLLITILAVIWASYHLYTTYFGMPDTLVHRSVHLTFALILTFILLPPSKKFKHSRLFLGLDMILVATSILIASYVIQNADTFIDRAGLPIFSDYIYGTIGIIIVIEATRRVLGLALPIVAIVFLIYAYTGEYWPSIFSHAGNDHGQIVSSLFLSLDGIFGIAIGVSSTILIIFILMAQFLMATGAGNFFMDMAKALIGWVRGGPAKVAVVSSGLFGSITGSAAANVVSTGAITIPLMKRLGYSPKFAGAVEATASTGGQLVPPIMGAAAFIMAETLSIPYSQVVIAAAVPSLLFFVSLLFMVDFEAAKNNLSGIPRKEAPSLSKTFKEGWFHALPLLLLFYLLLVVDYSPARAGFFAIVLIILINIINRKNRLSFKQFIKVLEKGAIGTMEIAIACGCAGIIIGSFALTGLGPRMSSILIELSQGYLLPLLILAMIAAIIMGMSLPTIVIYMVLAVMVAPTLVDLGVTPMAAHMFVFYYGVLSSIIPPIAFAAFYGAGIAGSDPMKTSFTAFRLSICALIIPYMFVYNPNLLLIGTGSVVMISVILAIIGVGSVAIGIQGYLFRSIKMWKRLLFFASGLFLIDGNFMTSVLGIVILTLLILPEYSYHRDNKKSKLQKELA
ncbi:TRAP transporter permease [Salicibibacter cibarius]|uniref:TRAP transporter permease n=1 Tax=Salicibibacter cibarius TaxID=2743000 RepID=A0A7T6Z4E5_9BACI|nr:TRAP transporter permease [Salicibibacter cibarius]QQK76582.1 TRAP transporter permease [Salicibibacter cibarius]